MAEFDRPTVAARAGTAAVIAINEEIDVQDVPYEQLSQQLLSGGQKLTWDPNQEASHPLEADSI